MTTQVMMANDAPRAYRVLFSRGTAAALVVLAAAFLAISQTRVVHDWLAMLHPAWPMWAWWVAAAGVELAILATGLVLANTGRRVLWAWEAGLVAASVAIGVDVSCRCLPEWARALVGGAMALQYLAVITAGHYLASGQDEATDDVASPVTASGQQTYTAPVDAPVVLANGSASAAGNVAKPLANGHDALAKYLATVASVGQDDAAVANAMGVSERTARRYRAMASNGYAEGGA